MKITLTVKVEWDKAKESLVEFRVKYDAFKAHTEHMQVMGMLPRGEIKWLISAVKKPLQLPADFRSDLRSELPVEHPIAGRHFIDGPPDNLRQFRGPAARPSCFHTHGSRLM